MYKISSQIRFFALLFLLIPFMTSCLGSVAPSALPALGSAMQFGSAAWVFIPGSIKIKKENENPFRTSSIKNVKTILVERPKTYEILKASKLFPKVKFIEKSPRIMEEAVKLAKQNGGDAYVWIDRKGMSSTGVTMIHQLANIKVILSNGECAYEQTIVISRKSGLYGKKPHSDEIEQYLIQTFVEELEGYLV